MSFLTCPLAQPGVAVVLTGARTTAAFAAATALAEPVKQRLGANPDMWMNSENSRFS